MDRRLPQARLAGMLRRLDVPLLEAAECADELEIYQIAAKCYEIATELIKLRRQLLELPPAAASQSVPEDAFPF